MKQLKTILIIVVAGAFAGLGYWWGDRTAPRPWVDERKGLYDKRWKLAKEVNEMRDVVRGYEQFKPTKPYAFPTTTQRK